MSNKTNRLRTGESDAAEINQQNANILPFHTNGLNCAMCRKPNAQHRARTAQGILYALCDGCFAMVLKAPTKLLLAIHERVDTQA